MGASPLVVSGLSEPLLQSELFLHVVVTCRGTMLLISSNRVPWKGV